MLWECSSYSTCRDNFQEALLLLELGVGLVSLVSHMVRVRAMLCMLV